MERNANNNGSTNMNAYGKVQINWAELKHTPADGLLKVSRHCGGMEYRHTPQTKIRCETIEVHNGNEGIRIVRLGSGAWNAPHRVNWRP